MFLQAMDSMAPRATPCKNLLLFSPFLPQKKKELQFALRVLANLRVSCSVLKSINDPFHLVCHIVALLSPDLHTSYMT
jgi:hypothetical protein